MLAYVHAHVFGRHAFERPERVAPRAARSAARDVLHALLARGDPRHHPAELGTDLLDRVLRGGLTHLVEVRPAVLVLGDPLLRERARLALAEDLLLLV